MMDWAKNGIPRSTPAVVLVMEGSSSGVRIEDLTKDQVAAQAKKPRQAGHAARHLLGLFPERFRAEDGRARDRAGPGNTKIVKGDKPTKEEQAILLGRVRAARSDYGVNNELKPAERQAMLAST